MPLSVDLVLLACLAHLDETGLFGDGDGLHDDGGGGLGDGLDGSLELGGGGSGGGGLLLVEDDEAGHVGLEAVNIHSHGLLGLVDPPGIDGNSDGAGVSGGQTGSLELGDGEATAELDLGVVALGLGVHSGAELVDGERCHGSGLGGPVSGGRGGGLKGWVGLGKCWVWVGVG